MAPVYITMADSDDEDGIPHQHPVLAGSTSAFIDLTRVEDTPEPGDNLLKAAATPKPGFSGSHNGTLQLPSTTVETSSGPASAPPTKFSPPSASRTLNKATQFLPSEKGRARAIHQSEKAVQDDDRQDGEEVESLGDPCTPSKRLSRGRPSSQRSVDKSVGTDSPLAQRYKEKRSRRENGNDTIRRNESPTEVMARRSVSTSQRSNPRQLDIADFEESLQRFEQEVLDNHAETVRWLLHDARRAVSRTKSVFMDKTSPFSSMEPVDALPAAAPEGAIRLKMDTFVSRELLSTLLRD